MTVMRSNCHVPVIDIRISQESRSGAVKNMGSRYAAMMHNVARMRRTVRRIIMLRRPYFPERRLIGPKMTSPSNREYHLPGVGREKHTAQALHDPHQRVEDGEVLSDRWMRAFILNKWALSLIVRVPVQSTNEF
jgi:hypothetical protein